MKHSQTLITNSDYFSAIPKKKKLKQKLNFQISPLMNFSSMLMKTLSS